MISFSIPSGHSKRTPRARRPITGIAATFLLSFTLTLLFAAAPAPVQAAIPTGPGDGMFDCLGSYDWGCQVIGWLFEDQNITNFRTNTPGSTAPNSIQTALRHTMAFFSNAILIIASLKLLFELIQMTAETAHTGHVGGKDTNQIWAPIRLVVAIGLLVPLSSGLNSGQYIVLQIAKWGSGFGSQVWRVFTEALSENQRLTAPSPADINPIVTNMMNIYACMHAINYYSPGYPDDQVRENTRDIGTRKYISFNNNVSEYICGGYTIKSPSAIPTNTPGGRAAARLVQTNITIFENYKAEINQLARDRIYTFLDNNGERIANRNDIDSLIERYRNDLKNAIDSDAASLTSEAYREITDAMKTHAASYGWMSAGIWFLAITRAQGLLLEGATSLPVVSSIQPGYVERRHPNAGAAYAQFHQYMQTAPLANTAAGLADDHSGRFVCGFGTLSTVFSAEGGLAISNLILACVNWMAEAVNLWPRGTGDDVGNLIMPIGTSNDPFSEISSIGQTHIKAALNIFGWMVGIGVGGTVIEGFGDMISKIPGVGSAIGGLLKGGATLAFLMLPLLGFIISLLMLGGVLLAFVLPMLPFLKFTFGIMTWIGTFLEAMICAPMLALAHLTPKGEGFAGPKTRTGYMLTFQLLLRPALMILGMIAAILIFYVMAKFLNGVYNEATRGVAVFKDGSGFLARLVYSIVYVAAMYTLANSSFKLIESIPQNAMRWMGEQAPEDKHDESSNIVAISAGTAMTTQLTSFMARTPASILSTPQKALRAMSDKGKSEAEKAKSAETSERRHNELMSALSPRGNRDGGDTPGDGSGNNDGGGGPRGGGGGGGNPNTPNPSAGGLLAGNTRGMGGGNLDNPGPQQPPQIPPPTSPQGGGSGGGHPSSPRSVDDDRSSREREPRVRGGGNEDHNRIQDTAARDLERHQQLVGRVERTEQDARDAKNLAERGRGRNDGDSGRGR